jgi:hypothetical protein
MRVRNKVSTATNRWTRAWGWLQVAVLVVAVVALANWAWNDGAKLLRGQALGIDFLPMWAAGHEVIRHPAIVYDFWRLTRFEHPLLGHFHGTRPFVYPPTALLAFVPLGALPFGLANALWTLGGVVAILCALGPRLKSHRALILAALLVSPASALVVLTGQVTFYVAAMALGGLLMLEKRPGCAGLLLGLAAAMKPQALILLPFALGAIGAWQALAYAIGGAAASVGAASLFFGVGLWTEWLAAVSRFEQWVMATTGLRRGMITPTALGMTLHLDPGGQDVWRLAAAAGALAMAVLVFRKTDDLARRLAALLGGGLFITPYAMHYDAALLAPSVALMLSQRTHVVGWIGALVAGALLCCAAIPYVGAAAVTALVPLAALFPAGAFAGRLGRKTTDFEGLGFSDLSGSLESGGPRMGEEAS